MSTKPIIPTADELVGAFKDAVRIARPSAAQHLDSGVYSQIATGLRAQAVLMLRRLTAAVMDRRVPLASGPALVNLLQSEIGTPPDLGGKFATGTVFSYRQAGSLPGGVIPKGTSISRSANPSAAIPVLGATYVTTADVFVAQGSVQSQIPVQASVTGTVGNTLNQGFDGTNVQTTFSSGSLFDPNLTIVSGSMGSAYTDIAGGTAGVSNGLLQKWARFSATQTNGPTLGNACAQVLIENGVSNFSVLDDPGTAALYLYVADESWGSGQTLCNNVLSQMQIGLGCLVNVYPVQNFPISVSAGVVLKDASYLSASQAITVNVQNGLKSYFDDRDDWFNWSTDGLKSAIIGSDTRIAGATNPQVIASLAWSDRYAVGAVVPEPAYDPRYDGFYNIGFVGPNPYGPPITGPQAQPAPWATHWYLVGSGVSLNFSSY